MILVLAIILFIIFLIHSIKPGREEYTLEGLKLSWKNKASIEGVVTKWIVTLKDSSENVIHTYENNESKNLKDFTDVSMNIVDKKEFDEKIIGDNKLELYYNEVKPDTKLYTKTVTFTEEDFGGVELDMSKLEEIVPNIDCVGKYIKVKKDKNTEGAERFACGPEADSDRHYCQFWKHKIEIEKRGTGKACSRADNFVIKTQWPTETTASKRIGTSFQNDPNPNTDENVLNDPQHYKNIWDRAPSRQPTYTKKENTVLWSNRNLDLDSGYDKKGNGGTLAGKDWKRSRWRGYPDECKKKCDSFPKCKGFVHYKGKKWCYLKSSNNLGKTSSHSKFDFYYK